MASRLKIGFPEAALQCLVKCEDDVFGRRGAERLAAGGIQPCSVDLVSGCELDRVEGAELIFHLAANTHTWESDQRCNDVGTENLVRALGELGPRQHVIFTSTVAVLDNRKDLREPLSSEVSGVAEPLSRYGRSKWKAEQWLIRQARENGFRLSILRLCTVYGSEPRPNSFFDALKKAVSRRALVARLNWPGLTSFVHVDDVVECLLATAENPPGPGKPRIQLVATESHTLAQVSELLHDALGVQYRRIHLPRAMWRLLGGSHWLCRWSRFWLPSGLYHFLWRFNLIVNPVFHCEVGAMKAAFPNLRPKRMEQCIYTI